MTFQECEGICQKFLIAFINDEYPPILCHRINYLKDKQYQGKFDDNPVHQK